MTVPRVAIMRKKKRTVRAGAKTVRDDTGRQRLAPSNATMESVGTPEAEAKDRIERVMNALAENRWNRRRKPEPEAHISQ
jgi:hypothetical protein